MAPTRSGFLRGSHLWLGLVTAVVVVAVSVTGILLNHRHGTGLYRPPPGHDGGGLEAARPVHDVLRVAVQAARDAGVEVRAVAGGLRPVRGPADVDRMIYRPGRGHAAVRFADRRHVEVTVDVASLAVIGVAPRSDVSLEHLHSGEILGQRGVIVTDVAALVLVALALGGLVLAVRRWRAGRGTTRQRDPLRLRVHRLFHLVAGLVVIVPLVVVAVTGVLLNHKRELGAMVEPFHQVDSEEVARREPLPFRALASTAASIAGRGLSEADVRWLDYRPRSGYVKVRFKDRRETEVIVDAFEPRVISAAPRRDVWLEQLHSGAVFGTRWVLLSDLTAGLAVLLTLNGLWLWLAPVTTARTRVARTAVSRRTPGAADEPGRVLST